MSPTIRQHLRNFPAWLWTHRDACRCSKAVPLYPFIQRHGLDVTLEEVRHRLRCVTCKDHPDSFTVPSPIGHLGFGEIPMDRVPAPLRSYALIDPSHLPAPLRG